MIQEKYRVHRNYSIYSIYYIILFSATVAEEELRDASLEQVEIQFPATEHLRHLKHETSLLTIQLVLSPCVWGGCVFLSRHFQSFLRSTKGGRFRVVIYPCITSRRGYRFISRFQIFFMRNGCKDVWARRVVLVGTVVMLSMDRRALFKETIDSSTHF